MSAVVSFVKPISGGAGLGAVGRVRKKEVLTVPASTTATAEAGELAFVFNSESTAVLVAFGGTPDAQAASETSATSAGITIGAGQMSPPLMLAQGDKVNVKTVA